ncbi:MAG: hypothetical protein WBM40_16830, partial [Thiohalocapsa sp.]
MAVAWFVDGLDEVERAVPRPLAGPSALWERLVVAIIPVAAVAIANRSHNPAGLGVFAAKHAPDSEGAL